MSGRCWRSKGGSLHNWDHDQWHCVKVTTPPPPSKDCKKTINSGFSGALLRCITYHLPPHVLQFDAVILHKNCVYFSLFCLLWITWSLFSSLFRPCKDPDWDSQMLCDVPNLFHTYATFRHLFHAANRGNKWIKTSTLKWGEVESGKRDVTTPINSVRGSSSTNGRTVKRETFGNHFKKRKGEIFL